MAASEPIPTPSAPVSPPASGTPDAWGVLGNPVFRALWLANVASQIGSTMHDTAAVWLMGSLTPSPTSVALMQSMSSMALLLFALPAGTLADIVDRRRMILSAQAFSIVVALIISAASWGDWISPGWLLGLTFLLAVGNAFTLPAWQALIPGIVTRSDLPAALTLGSLGVNVARGAGPVIGGLIVAASGPAAVFTLNALSFIGIIAVLFRSRPARPPDVPTHPEQIAGAIVAAIRFTRHSPGIHAVLIRHATFVFFGIAPMALLPVIVRSRDLGAAHFGMLMGAYGVGGVIAGLFLLPRLRARLSVDRLLVFASLLHGSMAWLLGVSHALPAKVIILFLAGAAWIAIMSTFTVVGQSLFPNWVRARSSAVQLVAAQAGLALGALTWGGITAQFDATFALQVAAAGIAVSAGLARYLPINAALKSDLSPSNHWQEHDPAIRLEDDAGPVLVSLDYTVDPAQAPEFEQAIRRLRTIRLRDGAFRWSLFHDLQNPAHFRESFLVGTWGEHLRQHERATAADREIEEAVVAFQRGEGPVVTHYLMR